MENWLLWIVIAFLAFMGMLGLKKGFIKMLFSIVSLIVTIILTMVINPRVSDYLRNKTKVYETVQEKTCEFIEDTILKAEEGEEGGKTIEELPFPDIIKNKLLENNNEDTYSLLGANTLGEYISIYIANIIVNAIAFCATFFVIFIAIRLVVYLLDLLSRLPLINGMNKLLGLALGLLEGLLVLWALCLVVTACAGTSWGRAALEQISNNGFLGFIYNNNYLMRIITDILTIKI